MNKIDNLGVQEKVKPKVNKDMFKIKMIEAKTSQTQLKDEINVSKQTFNNWVNGVSAPSLNTALWIAKRLNCSVEDIWEYQEKEE